MGGQGKVRDAELRTRAQAVVPGGMWGHLNAGRLPEDYPQFFARAQGCHLWDVDGHRYLDFMCSWGPVVLGHKHPEVEEAVRRQMDLGDCMNGPSETMVELAELLVDTIAHADWVEFQKNGTDATTLCVTIARAGTGARKVLVARGAYHGAVPWCSPSHVGVTAEDRAHLVYFDYNDVESLTAAVEVAKDDLAGILVSAFRHDVRRPQELPTPAFAAAARRLCDATGAALILDDVRAGFRLHLGGSWETLGVRPDLSAYSKAIANGYPLAAIAGTDRFREAATEVYATGSFWCGAVPMAAALATLRILRRDDAIAHMERRGAMLRAGLDSLARKHGLLLHQTGPVQMPMLSFPGETDSRTAIALCSAAIRQGLYLHPWHTMFLSAAHTEADIAEAMEIADRAFSDIEVHEAVS